MRLHARYRWANVKLAVSHIVGRKTARGFLMLTVEEIDEQIKALVIKRDEALKKEREADLKAVIALCRKHGFFANDLGDGLKKRKRGAAAAKKSP
jgi:hypothetical protein